VTYAVLVAGSGDSLKCAFQGQSALVPSDVELLNPADYVVVARLVPQQWLGQGDALDGLPGLPVSDNDAVAHAGEGPAVPVLCCFNETVFPARSFAVCYDSRPRWHLLPKLLPKTLPRTALSCQGLSKVIAMTRFL